MRILVLGGTAWLGREVARQAVAAGHHVVCAARGRAGEVAAGAALIVADRDRDDGLASVVGERWDAVVDVARHPGHVRRAARDLVTDHWVYVSSISVYADTARPGTPVSAPLVEPLASDRMPSMEVYGAAKVACERHLLAAVGEGCTIARVGLIGGPGDTYDRVAYWPSRFAAAVGDAPVLVPDLPDLDTSVIDVRDLAAWLLRCATEQITGTFNVQGPVTSLGDHLDLARAVGGGRGTMRVADPAWLVEKGVRHWMGPRSLPLWLPDEQAGLMGVDAGAAYDAGLSPRTLEQTLTDTLATRRTDPGRAWQAGLTDAEEADLLAALSRRTAPPDPATSG